jgi:hypothetical protein
MEVSRVALSPFANRPEKESCARSRKCQVGNLVRWSDERDLPILLEDATIR